MTSNQENRDALELEAVLSEFFLGVTSQQVAYALEGCLICLDYHQHRPGCIFFLQTQEAKTLELRWTSIVTEQMRRGWRDLEEATEQGATALALALIISQTPYTVVERSIKGDGFDYQLAEKDDILERADDEIITSRMAGLEVSGILSAHSQGQIETRVKEKVQQARSKHHLTVIVIVAEFSRPQARIETYDE